MAADDESGTAVGRAAAHCWALLLARIYECLPLACPRCGEPMRIIAFILDRSVIERILTHIVEPTEAPEVLPARGPPQAELGFGQVDQTVGQDAWPEMDQTARDGGDTWEWIFHAPARLLTAPDGRVCVLGGRTGWRRHLGGRLIDYGKSRVVESWPDWALGGGTMRLSFLSLTTSGAGRSGSSIVVTCPAASTSSRGTGWMTTGFAWAAASTCTVSTPAVRRSPESSRC